jgi:pimeloyl-ACP methyl ester carboxylesterase
MHQRELIRPDARIRYWTGGPEPAPTLVLLHGATLDHHAWSPQVDAVKSRYRVVVPDLRGHGASTRPGQFTFEDAVADIVALLEQLDVRRIGLVGLSLGGNIAQEIVFRDPARVAALVVADSTCNTAPRHTLQVPMTIASLSGLGMLGRDALLHATANLTAQDPAVQHYVRTVNRTRSTQDTIQILSSMLTSALHPDEAYHLPVPTLLMHGDNDHLGDVLYSTRAWSQREPLAEYVAIPRARHASNQDNPLAFSTAMTTFLDRTLAPAADTAQRSAALG